MRTRWYDKRLQYDFITIYEPLSYTVAVGNSLHCSIDVDRKLDHGFATVHVSERIPLLPKSAHEISVIITRTNMTNPYSMVTYYSLVTDCGSGWCFEDVPTLHIPSWRCATSRSYQNCRSQSLHSYAGVCTVGSTCSRHRRPSLAWHPGCSGSGKPPA